MLYVLGLMNVYDRIKIENPPATAKGFSGSKRSFMRIRIAPYFQNESICCSKDIQ